MFLSISIITVFPFPSYNFSEIIVELVFGHEPYMFLCDDVIFAVYDVLPSYMQDLCSYNINRQKKIIIIILNENDKFKQNKR
jgi:hypothetical protein